MIKLLSAAASWFASEYWQDYRVSNVRAYELIIKTNMQLNQIILTVSVASLAAVAALNEAVFVPFPLLSFTTLSLFILVILLSTVNFYLTTIALRDIQQLLKKDVLFPLKVSRKKYQGKYNKTQKILSASVLIGFCLGLVLLLVLLGSYIFGVAK